jgi:predicted metal-dependent hydrolase
MGIYNINIMDITKIAEHMNTELKKGRTQKDIETNDFGVNEKVVKNRLDRKGYKKVDNQWILKDTTIETTKIIQNELIQDQQEKKAFNDNEIEKLNQLLNIDIDSLNKMINEYTTNKNTSCIIKIKDNKSMVTSLRLNKELYQLVKDKAKSQAIGISDIFNDMMIDYLNK